MYVYKIRAEVPPLQNTLHRHTRHQLRVYARLQVWEVETCSWS
jgi:hypothetical protein